MQNDDNFIYGYFSPSKSNANMPSFFRCGQEEKRRFFRVEIGVRAHECHPVTADWIEIIQLCDECVWNVIFAHATEKLKMRSEKEKKKKRAHTKHHPLLIKTQDENFPNLIFFFSFISLRHFPDEKVISSVNYFNIAIILEFYRISTKWLNEMQDFEKQN